MNPSIANIPPTLLNEYLQDFFSEFRKSPLWEFKLRENGDEDISEHMKSIIVYGKKPKQ